jgi:NAD(P)-dependent dehydrogenase (short-subunit alcohol dehydrogenase family)
MKKLENKVIVIVGASNGIGLSIAKLFAVEGAKVFISRSDQNTVDGAIGYRGNGSLGQISDVSDINNIDASYEDVKETFGMIDILVINASIFVNPPLLNCTEETFDKTIDINFKRAFFSVQKAINYLNDGASIILMSTSGKGLVNGPAHVATKETTQSLATSFSAELLERRIRASVSLVWKKWGNNEQLNDLKATLIESVPIKWIDTSE